MAHAEDAGNVGHRQPVLVCGADRFVALGSQFLGSLLKLALAAGVVVGKGRQARAGLGCLALGARDLGIV